MKHVTLKLFTHKLGPGPPAEAELIHTALELTVPEADAPAVVRSYYNGDGHTSVHEETLAQFPVAD